jgi:general secretion pathway protein H
MAVNDDGRGACGGSRGFTLIEVLVVVAIIVVIVGLAGVQLMRGPADIVREESEHLALLLRAAREEAILQGRVYAFGAGRETYRFLRLEPNGRLKPTADDEVFRPQRLPPGITISSLKVEGAGDSDSPLKLEGAGDADQEGLVFLPSGELPAFRVVLEGGGASWSIVGTPDGSIIAKDSS